MRVKWISPDTHPGSASHIRKMIQKYGAKGLVILKTKHAGRPHEYMVTISCPHAKGETKEAEVNWDWLEPV